MIKRVRCFVLSVSVVIIHLILLVWLEVESQGEIRKSLNLNFFNVRKLLHQSTDRMAVFNTMADQEWEKYTRSLEKDPEASESRGPDPWVLDKGSDSSIEKITLPSDPMSGQKQIAEAQFDIRLTLGLALHHVDQQIRSQDSMDDLLFSQFHWADWVNTTALNPFFAQEEKEKCKEFFDMSTASVKKNEKQELYPAEEYCVDDESFDTLIDNDSIDIYVKKILNHIKSQPASTGFHIFRYAGRSTSALKILHAKSFLYDFMPPPLSVVLLLPSKDQTGHVYANETILSIPVSQNVEDRVLMRSSHMLQNYLGSRRNSPDPPTLDLRYQIERLTDIVSKKSMSPSNWPYPDEKTLSSKDFIDRSSEILSEMEDDEEKILTAAERLYMESLRYSLEEVNPPKYFHEARMVKAEMDHGLGAHFDWRFFNGLPSDYQTVSIFMHGLIRAWLAFTGRVKCSTWLAHGSLLSWYWNGVAFPWDYDIDVQMPIADLHSLCKKYNQSLIVDLGSEGDAETRHGKYFLDCGTFISTRTRSNGNNNIDARFIDVDNGYYVDITGLALSASVPPNRYRQLLDDVVGVNEANKLPIYDRNGFLRLYNCRNNHFSLYSELSPLRLTMYEGQPTYVPHDYESLLKAEYGERGISQNLFEQYTFLPQLRLWIKTPILHDLFHDKYDGREVDLTNSRKIEQLTEDDYRSLLSQRKEILAEYLLLRNTTIIHEQEIELLSRGKSTKNLISQYLLDAEDKSLRHDYFNVVTHEQAINNSFHTSA
ncbi:Piso0_000342 [Millerozyma farinosa CBS 7064]|uniref:Piso0_000342 protein n=1 Tax=Pichia sorbitophila (strain ATCC MYA-4447 / BCRC 22081 / CBS 7064 / NBRC 10061 / NRRL Y-12695) TaxID=559304 RepID=G8YV65_PICSO|nr:Piso0_000342 [Millerozyma farinosa CBS 7064]CCE73309.1 Piso0_000342 [Millerozyma farinosa CBS 7064]